MVFILKRQFNIMVYILKLNFKIYSIGRDGEKINRFICSKIFLSILKKRLFFRWLKAVLRVKFNLFLFIGPERFELSSIKTNIGERFT
jgi:hypothetical protein